MSSWNHCLKAGPSAVIELFQTVQTQPRVRWNPEVVKKIGLAVPSRVSPLVKGDSRGFVQQLEPTMVCLRKKSLNSFRGTHSEGMELHYRPNPLLPVK